MKIIRLLAVRLNTLSILQKEIARMSLSYMLRFVEKSPMGMIHLLVACVSKPVNVVARNTTAKPNLGGNVENVFGETVRKSCGKR